MTEASFTANQTRPEIDTVMPGLSEIVAELVEHAPEEVVKRLLINVINTAKADIEDCSHFDGF